MHIDMQSKPAATTSDLAKNQEELIRLHRSNQPRDWSKGIDLARQMIPIWNDSRRTDTDLSAFLINLPRQRAVSYETSLPAEDWRPERRAKVKLAIQRGEICWREAEKTGDADWVRRAFSAFLGAGLPLPEWIVQCLPFILESSEAHEDSCSKLQDAVAVLLMGKLVFERKKPHVAIGEVACALKCDKKTPRRRMQALRKMA